MGHHSKKKVKLSTKEKLNQIKKERKQKLKQKRAKLIVRNLPFQATEETLKEHFEKFGEIEEIKILKKEDGKLVGCAFIQFKLVQKAAKARHHTNGKPFLGREINVDFALAKNTYEKTKVKNDDPEIKTEPEDVKIKEEKDDSDNENKSKDESSKKNSDTSIDSNTLTVDDDSDNEGDDDDDEGDDDDDDDDDEKDSQIDIKEEKRVKRESHDISENKTIFIKNVPFTATNEDLKQCMLQFGPVYYALICIDKFTEHSKGTAFVKFREVEDAEKALNAGTELTLMGNVLDCHRALERKDIQAKHQQKLKEKEVTKDSRNLYLVKEGVILAGTKAAEGVSAADMAKRLQIEQYKTQMLRNLNMFISRERLVIHNLPLTWDDKKLRTLFANHSSKNAIIREARVMRDLRDVDANGVGRSKGFGFVTFSTHQDALAALRKLNNNPNIFTPNKRPIITFSIENKSMIKTKQKRLEKSRANNPISKDFDPEKANKTKEKTKKNIKKEQRGKQEEEKVNGGAEETEFAGCIAKPGPQKMRSKFKLQTQAQIHFTNLKKEKKKQKLAKKTLKEKQKEFTKQPQQKINKKRKLKEDDDFAKIVAKYRRTLIEAPTAKKSKWFEQDKE